MSKTSRVAFVLLVSTVCVLSSSFVIAQDFPTKPVRLIIADNPGAGSDIIARIVAPAMAKFLGQPIVVENKPGAVRTIGFEYVAKQVPADGYTLVMAGVSSLAILPVIMKDLRFDPLKDLSPVIHLVEGRLIFASSSGNPWKSFNEMVAYAKANPGKLNYAASGPNTRLPTEAIIRELGLNIVPVNYTGGSGPVVLALIRQEIHMGFIGEAAAASMGEKLRILAVTGRTRRPPFLDVPLFAELGFPQIGGQSYSLNVRAGTPKPIIDKLYAAGSRALQEPEVTAALGKLFYEILNDTPEATEKSLAERGKNFAEVAKKIGLRPE